MLNKAAQEMNAGKTNQRIHPTALARCDAAPRRVDKRVDRCMLDRAGHSLFPDSRCLVRLVDNDDDNGE